MSLEQIDEQKKYLSILSDGSIRLKVEEGTEGAKKREYETSDGTKGVKFELVYKSISGHINDISFQDGDYGKMLQVTIDEHVLSVNTSNNFATDIMKKLPNVALDKEVKLVPYSFEDEKGKTKRGVTIYQNEEKIKDFFYDGKENTNGFPKVEDKEYDTDDWKIYFIGVSKFLIKYIEDNIVDKVEAVEPVATDDEDNPF